ncbi:hypothetical protein [Saccharopolyspora kobensis]|uniref:hypothetical protein n=1 Tax=Saccharopolyspora kobensis TaxID=146035 RepID=UPI0011614179|nr:hypothetical protein [Saccharopolyspora kobensis]
MRDAGRLTGVPHSCVEHRIPRTAARQALTGRMAAAGHNMLWSEAASDTAGGEVAGLRRGPVRAGRRPARHAR